VAINPDDLAGDGLVAGQNCELDVNVGCGLEIAAAAVTVKSAPISLPVTSSRQAPSAR